MTILSISAMKLLENKFNKRGFTELISSDSPYANILYFICQVA